MKTTAACGQRRHVLRWATLGILLLAGCGGGGEEEGSPQPASETTSFEAYLATRFAAGASGTAAAEAAAIGRAWAVQTLFAADPLAADNVVTAPPLRFGLLQVVREAARGETLDALRLVVGDAPPAAVQAELTQTLQRRLSAPAGATFRSAFLQALAFDGQASGPSVTTETHRAPDGARLTVQDSLDQHLVVPLVERFDGIFQGDSGVRIRTELLRFAAPAYHHVGAGWQAHALRLSGGVWLVKLEPTGSLAAWGAGAVEAALAQTTAALAASPPVALASVVLPQTSLYGSAGLDDRRGMALASDPVRADLSGVDGQGGMYLQAPPGSVSLAFHLRGVSATGQQSSYFMPKQPSANYGFAGQSVTFPTTIPCPAGAADLRPAYFALVMPTGTVTVLARLAWVTGTVCA